MILASVGMGLDITEILTGWTNLLRTRAQVRFPWIHMLLPPGASTAWRHSGWFPLA